MLSTGDVQNYLRKLQTELRFIKFRDVDYKSFVLIRARCVAVTIN